MIDVLQYSEGINLQKIVDEQARKLQRNVDEATLDKAADTLANFGYVKVNGKSRWAELFGTPERAARLISDNCGYLDYCGQCWVRAANCDGKYSTVLEWLRGDVE